MADDAETTSVATPPKLHPPAATQRDEPAPMRGGGLVQTVKDYGGRLLRFIRSRVNTDEDAEDVL